MEPHFLPELSSERFFESFTWVNPTTREDPERVSTLRRSDAKQKHVRRRCQENGTDRVPMHDHGREFSDGGLVPPVFGGGWMVISGKTDLPPSREERLFKSS
jgi:hypothetical protein